MLQHLGGIYIGLLNFLKGYPNPMNSCKKHVWVEEQLHAKGESTYAHMH